MITGKCLITEQGVILHVISISLCIGMFLFYFVCKYSVVRQHLPGERLVYVEARFGGLEVTLGDELGYILSADMTGMWNTLHAASAYGSIYML